MTIRIDRKKCDGCGLSKQPPCMKICPGDLIYKDFTLRKAALRCDADCWDCYCCVKACPKEAIDLVLAYEISNRGASLKPRALDEHTIEWVLRDRDWDLLLLQYLMHCFILQSFCFLLIENNSEYLKTSILILTL